MKNNKLLRYLWIFLGIYLVVTFVFPAQKQTDQKQESVLFHTTKQDFPLGETVKVVIQNNSATGSLLFTPQSCPKEPLTVYRGDEIITANTQHKCDSTPFEIKPKASHNLTFDKWNNQLFLTEGDYKIVWKTTIDGKEKTLEAPFKIRASNWFGSLFDLILYRPIYNLLIFLATSLPGNDLGFAIILLTILIRIILLIPNQRALEQQKKLQKIQPKIAEIQKKYEGAQQKIGEETLKLWKEHKVNPMGSCLPMLLQMPVLIALYWAISNGLDAGSTYFLYEPLKHINIDIMNANFLGILDLSKPNITVLPAFLGILQFVQMKLSFSMANKKKKDLIPASTEKKPMDPNATVNKSMTYIFPLLIVFMTISFPAGVAIYWGISTIFGIAQQIWVNRERFVP